MSLLKSWEREISNSYVSPFAGGTHVNGGGLTEAAAPSAESSRPDSKPALYPTRYPPSGKSAPGLSAQELAIDTEDIE